MKVSVTHALLAAVVLFLCANLAVGPGVLRTVSAQSSTPVPDVLRARRFDLVSADGRIVAQLHADEDGGGQLRLRSAAGTVRVKLGSSSDGAAMILMNERAEPAIWLAVGRGGSSITLAEAGGRKRIIAP